MDKKITFSFDEAVIAKAKEYTALNNISVSRLTEYQLRKVTICNHAVPEDYPIADWISTLAEGEVAYQRQPKARKELDNKFFNSKK